MRNNERRPTRVRGLLQHSAGIVARMQSARCTVYTVHRITGTFINSRRNEWLHNILWYHWLVPIGFHF